MRLRATLLAILLALFVILGIAPLERDTWAVENALFVAALVVLLATRRALPLTDLSVWLVFVFLVLHEVGAHYTYSLVPYDRWFQAVTGRTLNSILGFERNHYDRLVHCAFGLLLAVPMRELFLRVADARGFVSYWLPVQMTLSFSALYELLEWAAAEVFGGDLGTAYLGTQGDEWDAQKDMGLAALGALCAMGTLAAFQRARGADLQRRALEQNIRALAARRAAS
ncbi:MAG: DUF2238 domain-containing protein [Planctomycetes bacterium]|nr:DUF2238 domain-containing protein [Planctomycetota bacterium]